VGLYLYLYLRSSLSVSQTSKPTPRDVSIGTYPCDTFIEFAKIQVKNKANALIFKKQRTLIY